MNTTLGNNDYVAKDAIRDESFVPQDAVRMLRAKLRDAIQLPANGPTEEALYDHKGVTIFYSPSGLFCTYGGCNFIVPLANVLGCYTTYNKSLTRR